jgi:PAS domain S-box-containing protein
MGSARPRESRRFLRVAAVFLLTFAAMFVFEAVKEAIVPEDLTRWGSHWITILFATIAAGLVSSFGFRAYEREAEERRRAETAREAAVLELQAALSQTQGLAQTLGKSEEMFSKIFRFNPAVMVIARAEGKGFVDANDAMLEACGFTRDEVIGRNGVDLGVWDAAARDAFREKLKRNGRVRNELTEFNTKRGRRSMLLSGEYVDVGGETLTLVMAHDVTERLAAECALRDSEERLRRSEEMFSKIFRSNPALMVIARMDGTGIVDANDAMLETCGFTHDEVIGRNAVDLGLWDGSTRDSWLEQLAAKGRIRNELTEITTRRGRRAMLLSGEQVDVGGETLTLVMAHDISERLAAERALRDSEERLRRSEEMFSKVFRSSPAAMTIVEYGTGRILDVNDAFLHARGYMRDELLGRTTVEAKVWRSLEDRQGFMAAFHAEGSVRDFPAEVPTKAGAMLSLLVSAEVVEIAGGPCIVSMSRDVTDWLEAERRLKDSEERLRLALTAARMGAWDWDAETDRIGWSERENAVCGFAPGTQIKTFDDYIALTHPDDVARLKECVARTRGGRRVPYKNEHRVLQPDGGFRWVESRGQGFQDERGGAGRIVGTVVDMSERKQLEETLRRQETLASIGSLVAGVAHEVRTPLFSISATLDAFEGGTPAEMEEGAQLLRAQVRRLSNLMSDLLEFGRPPVLQMEPGGIEEILRRAVVLCGPLAAEAGVTVRPVLAFDPLVVSRDARRLEQAFQNLVANAIQHAPRGSEVQVVAQPFQRRAGDYVECRVEDGGPGIPEDSLYRVFEPFFSRRKGGTGLGLPIVQRIVEAHGGTVTAANRPAGGAVFTVTLPASPAEGERRV